MGYEDHKEMGAICGCKRSNVVQPSSSVKTNHSSSAASKHFGGALILDLTDSGSLSKHSLADTNYNNNNASSSEQVQQAAGAMLNEDSVLKKYNLQTVIGEGSFSKVFRIENRQTGEYFALKITDKAKSLESGMPCYKRELAILKRARHQNIITLHEVFHSNSKLYLILELASGGNLFDRISSSGAYNEPLAQRTLSMITNALSYLHRVGVTHRDLKLENLLYKNSRKDSKILISDFGLSHMTEGDASRNVMWTTCGSEEYIAPEVLDGLEYSNAIDNWALGVITYAVLCAYMPFTDQNRARLHQKILSGMVSFREQVSQFF